MDVIYGGPLTTIYLYIPLDKLMVGMVDFQLVWEILALPTLAKAGFSGGAKFVT